MHLEKLNVLVPHFDGILENARRCGFPEDLDRVFVAVRAGEDDVRVLAPVDVEMGENAKIFLIQRNDRIVLLLRNGGVIGYVEAAEYGFPGLVIIRIRRERKRCLMHAKNEEKKSIERYKYFHWFTWDFQRFSLKFPG